MQLPRIKIVMRLGPGSYGTIQYTLFELGTFGNALRELPGHGQFDCRRSFRIEMSGRNPRETIREKKSQSHNLEFRQDGSPNWIWSILPSNITGLIYPSIAAAAYSYNHTSRHSFTLFPHYNS